MPDAVDGVITITTAEQLAALAKNVNDGNSYSGQTIKLGSDLDLSGHNWTPIGWYDDTNRVDYYFKGTFDGDGHTISNLTIGGSNSYVGLFGQVGEGGTVKDLTLTDVNVSGNSYVGGLVGKNKDTITNCTVTGSIFSGDDYVGGLVGQNDGGTVTDNAVKNVSVTGTGSGAFVGGLVGTNSGGTVKNNKFYSNQTKEVGTNANNGKVENNTQVYKLTLQGVEVTGDKVAKDSNGNYYAAGTVTLKASAANAIIRSTNSSYTNNDDGTVSVTPTADTSISSSDIAFYYAISGLNNITASGGTYKTVNGTTYYKSGSSVTLTAGTGAIIGAATASGGSVTVNNSGTATLTTTSAVSTVTPTLYYSVSGLNNVTASGGTYKTVNGTTYYKSGSSVTLTAGTGAIIGAATASGGSVTVNSNGTATLKTTSTAATVTPTLYYAVSGLNNVTASGGTSKTVNGTNYYKSGSSVTLTAGTGAIIGAATASGGSVTINSNGTATLTTTSSAATVTPTLYYKLTLPNGFTASGTGYGGNYSDYYTGNVTIAERTGYSLSQTSIENISSATEITATVDTTNHYAFSNGDGYTYATDSNVASNNYPDLVQVYALTLSDGVTVTGDTVATDSNGNYYAAGNVTLTAANGYTLQNVTVDGTTYDGNTLTVNADTKILADCIKSINGGKGVEVGGTTGNLSTFNGVYSISASQENSTLTGNNNNNNVVIAGGGENILTGGGGNDTYKFESGGGIFTDFGIGSTKDSAGKLLSPAPGSDVLKVDGKVTGVYFDRAASNKNSANFTAVVAYDNTGDSTADQVVMLKDINKKPTKYSSDPSKAVYQTNDAAAATLKIWDTSGSKQTVLFASKLKALFRDDSDLTDDLKTQLTTLSTNLGIGDLNLPAVDALNQTAQATFNGSND